MRSNYLLDLVLTNTDDIISNLCVTCPFSTSDHNYLVNFSIIVSDLPDGNVMIVITILISIVLTMLTWPGTWLVLTGTTNLVMFQRLKITGICLNQLYTTHLNTAYLKRKSPV